MSALLVSWRRLLLLLLLLLLLVAVGGSLAAEEQGEKEEDEGEEGEVEVEEVPGWFAQLRALLQGCPAAVVADSSRSHEQGLVSAVCECARRRAWRAIDRILEDDLIPLVQGVQLVRIRKQQQQQRQRHLSEVSADSTRRPVNDSIALRKLFERARFKEEPSKMKRGEEEKQEEEEKEVNWHDRVSSRLARVLGSHVIKIDVDRLRPLRLLPTPDAKSTGIEPRGRRRRKQMQMMPIVMMGVLLMGSVLIPMGFQFLAVLGGKALILAKMALMLSSIQGLKKIATSGVNYGLYHTGVPEPWHERSSYLELPYDATAHHVQPTQHHPAAAALAAGPYLDHYIRRSASIQPPT